MFGRSVGFRASTGKNQGQNGQFEAVFWGTVEPVRARIMRRGGPLKSGNFDSAHVWPGEWSCKRYGLYDFGPPPPVAAANVLQPVRG